MRDGSPSCGGELIGLMIRLNGDESTIRELALYAREKKILGDKSLKPDRNP